jgi:predicted DNA-binding transcriptional regulator AlpA
MQQKNTEAAASALMRGPAPAWLNAKQAAGVFGISERTFHVLRHEPWMPCPIQLGPRILRWSRVELETARADIPRQSGGCEPSQLAAGRAKRKCEAQRATNCPRPTSRAGKVVHSILDKTCRA